MGWSLKIQETKKHGKRYKFWTSVSDGWVNDEWLTRDEMIKFLFWTRLEKMADTFIEDSMTFPNGWSAKDEMRRLPIDEELSEAFYEWRHSTFKADDYYEAIFEKFAEMLDKSGINLSVHDGQYNFSNTEHKINDYSTEALAKLSEQSVKEIEEIAAKYGLTYSQAIDFWTDMNKQWKKMRDPLHPANYKDSEQK